MCDEGESQQELLERFEGSLVGPSIRPVPFTSADGGEGVDLFLDPGAFREAFAADVDQATADVMAAAQRPYAAAAFAGAPSRPPAWKTLPCWYLLGTRGQGDPAGAAAVHGRARERDDRGGVGLARFVRVAARRCDPAHPSGRQRDYGHGESHLTVPCTPSRPGVHSGRAAVASGGRAPRWDAGCGCPSEPFPPSSVMAKLVIHRTTLRSSSQTQKHDQSCSGSIALCGSRTRMLFASGACSNSTPGRPLIAAASCAAISLAWRRTNTTAHLRAAHPDLVLTLSHFEPPDGLTQLAAGDVDAVVTHRYPGVTWRTPTGVRTTHLIRDPLMLMVPADHALSARKRVDMERLRDEPFISGNPDDPNRTALATACASAGFVPTSHSRPPTTRPPPRSCTTASRSPWCPGYAGPPTPRGLARIALRVEGHTITRELALAHRTGRLSPLVDEFRRHLTAQPRPGSGGTRSRS